MDSYAAVEEGFEEALRKLQVRHDVNSATGQTAPVPLAIAKVGISGSGYMEASTIGDSPDPYFAFAAKVPGLRGLNVKDVQAGFRTLLKDAFATVPLPDGSKLADHYDFALQPEEPKTKVEDAERLRDTITKALAAKPDVVPPQVQEVLLKADVMHPDKETFFGCWSPNGISSTDGHIEAHYNFRNLPAEGGLTTAAMIEANLAARKDVILAEIRAEAVQSGVNIPEAELKNLDFKVHVEGSGVEGKDGDLRIEIGTKRVADPAHPGEEKVGPTALAGLDSEHLHRIVADSLLFKGEGAEKVAGLIASRDDIKHLLNAFAPEVPGLDKAAEDDLLTSWQERQKRENDPKTKIVPKITIDTSLDEHLHSVDQVHVNLKLPEGIAQSQLIAALAGQRGVTPPAAVTETPLPASPQAETMPSAANENQPKAAPDTPTALTGDAPALGPWAKSVQEKKQTTLAGRTP